jgi:aminopeptidase-like protein
MNENMAEIGSEMHGLMRELYPICRSITGNGVRQTLNILRRDIPLKVHEVASGTKVFDWTVPREWNIKDAYVKNSKGEKIIDFKKSNLHVLNYSVPIQKGIYLEELKEHLFTLPEHPDWIPYRTSYYSEDWGFCLSHNEFKKLQQDIYEVCIESSLENGHLTYGEYYLEGENSDEVLISTHVCHPSLCSDNLAGIVLAVSLAKYLSRESLRYSYRFLFIPGTIGSITWLYLNEHQVAKIKHGLVVACVGDSGKFTYKKTRQQDAEIDNIAAHVLKESGKDFDIIDFFPYGYDERQYCSPGFDLPVGCLMRTPHGQFPEYHTSADNLEFVRPENLADSFSMYLAVLNRLENNKKYVNQNPKCEPQLGKRGLYDKLGGLDNGKALQFAMLWVLNLSDGNHTIMDISERAGLEFDLLKEAADTLVEHRLLKEIGTGNE